MTSVSKASLLWIVDPTLVFENGTDSDTTFSTLPDAASIVWVISPTSTNGSRPSARMGTSSELDVYTRRHVPPSWFSPAP